MRPSLAGLLLAGGQSRRMGRDKRFLEVDGVPLVLRTHGVAQEAVASIRIAVADATEVVRLQRILGPEVEVRVDSMPGQGPLAALADGLEDCEADWLLLLAVDYPLLSARFLKGLREAAATIAPAVQAVVPVVGERRHYTCACYRRELAAPVREAVRGGERSLRVWLASGRAQVCFLRPAEWPLLEDPAVLLNWNAESDWNPD